LYNTLALEALKKAATKTSPQTPLRINDLHHDMVAYCGVGYKKCQLQLTGGVHCTQEGREYTGLSVSFSILDALFSGSNTSQIGSGNESNSQHPKDQPNALPSASESISGIEHQHGSQLPACGEPPRPLNHTVPNILLIGDSISMGYG
jgi:hypothetical protein